MTGKWTIPGVPHTGWRCEGISDLGDEHRICEMCEMAEIRYAHQMSHADYADSLAVGCVCAGFMEQNRARAENRERRFLNALTRRGNWLARKWRRSRNGRDYLNTDGYNIVIFKRSDSWASRITERVGGEFWESKKYYQTADAAKLGALDGLLWILDQKRFQ